VKYLPKDWAIDYFLIAVAGFADTWSLTHIA
jgi:hypothetical protein